MVIFCTILWCEDLFIFSLCESNLLNSNYYLLQVIWNFCLMSEMLAHKIVYFGLAMLTHKFGRKALMNKKPFTIKQILKTGK